MAQKKGGVNFTAIIKLGVPLSFGGLTGHPTATFQEKPYLSQDETQHKVKQIASVM